MCNRPLFRLLLNYMCFNFIFIYSAFIKKCDCSKEWKYNFKFTCYRVNFINCDKYNFSCFRINQHQKQIFCFLFFCSINLNFYFKISISLIGNFITDLLKLLHFLRQSHFVISHSNQNVIQRI